MPINFPSTPGSLHRDNTGPGAAFAAQSSLAVFAAILLLAAGGCATPQTAPSLPPPQPAAQNPASEQLLAAVRQASVSGPATPAPPPQPSAQNPANMQLLAAVRQASVSAPATPAPASPQATLAPPPAQNPSTAQLLPAVRLQPLPAQANAAPLTAVPPINPGTNSLVLQEGDAVQITFPGAPTLNTTVIIRRDGKISLNMIGDIDAAGMTPNQLEKVLLDKYGPQLVVKEVNVSVTSAAFIIYVTGAVLRPGKLASERPLTPLQAIIEAGIDSAKSNLKAVKIIRIDERGHTDSFRLNLRRILDGKQTEPFTLRPLDIIVVPEKFTWF